jgi:hypothetical protein
MKTQIKPADDGVKNPLSHLNNVKSIITAISFLVFVVLLVLPNATFFH